MTSRVQVAEIAPCQTGVDRPTVCQLVVTIGARKRYVTGL